jgi:hypothetical protein
MTDEGIRLSLLIGPTIPVPAPWEVTEALKNLEITCNDRERDGFQMTFDLDKGNQEYGLLQSGILDPPNRVIISVIIGAISSVLMDGFITKHQVVPGNQPGRSTLQVTGEDISIKLDLEEKNAAYPNQTDSAIVRRILDGYATYGLIAQIEETGEVSTDAERVPTQQGTDLTYLQQLAAKNGFVFFIEPSASGSNIAYWGPEPRRDQPQTALTVNMGPYTNVDSQISFDFNSLEPTDPKVSIVDPSTRQSIPVPQASASLPPLSSQPAAPMRITLARDSAKLNLARGSLRTRSMAGGSSSAVTATGELDAARYGQVLLPRRLVGVRGAGESYDGIYYVKQVKHRIKRGEYKQSFTLLRDGRGSSVKVVQ